MIVEVDGFQIVWPDGVPLPGKGDTINLGEKWVRIVEDMTFFPTCDPPLVRIGTVEPISDWPSAVRYREKQERGPWWNRKKEKVDV